MLLILFITKGHNSLNIIHGVESFIVCTSSKHGLHLYQVSRKCLKWFQSNGTISMLLQRHNSFKIVRGVLVLVLCILSNHGLHMHQI